MGAQYHADRNGAVSCVQRRPSRRVRVTAAHERFASPHDDAALRTRAEAARVPIRRSIPEKMIACAGSRAYQ